MFIYIKVILNCAIWVIPPTSCMLKTEKQMFSPPQNSLEYDTVCCYSKSCSRHLFDYLSCPFASGFSECSHYIVYVFNIETTDERNIKEQKKKFFFLEPNIWGMAQEHRLGFPYMPCSKMVTISWSFVVTEQRKYGISALLKYINGNAM